MICPSNHKLVTIHVEGITDTDGDDVDVLIVAIFSDEPVDHDGDGSSGPDGQGVGSSTAKLRAERAGTGDGRVYHIGFVASDGQGGECAGEVLVQVPHDRRAQAVDGGPLFDATKDESE
jgi:hypothetical protein